MGWKSSPSPRRACTVGVILEKRFCSDPAPRTALVAGAGHWNDKTVEHHVANELRDWRLGRGGGGHHETTCRCRS